MKLRLLYEKKKKPPHKRWANRKTPRRPDLSDVPFNKGTDIKHGYGTV